MSVKFVAPLPRTATQPPEGEAFYVSATSARAHQPASFIGWRSLVNGYDSALGSWGPLSATVGPVSDVGPSEFIRHAANTTDWQAFAAKNRQVDLFANPRSPLSSSGPLNKDAYDAVMNPILAALSADRFFGGAARAKAAEQLAPGGVAGIAGPGGINNAAGWMGMLGPIGAYATRLLRVNEAGDYIDQRGRVVGQLDVAWDETSSRPLPLVEKYTFARATELSKKGKLDATFMVDRAALTRDGDSHSYTVNVPAGEVVNIVVLPADPGAPLYNPSDFDLEVRDARGNELLANSIERDAIDSLQMYLTAPQKVQVRVVLKKHSRAMQGKPTEYRLVVDTATKTVKPDPNVRGPHQLRLRTVAVEE